MPMSEERPSPGEIRRLLRRLSTADRRLRATLASKLELSAMEWEVLEQIAEDVGATPGRIAPAEGLTSGGVTSLLDRLDRRGFISRGPHPHDRRKVLLSVTTEFTRQARELTAHFSSEADQLIDRLSSEDGEALVRLLGEYVRLIERTTEGFAEPPDEPEREPVELWM